MVSVGATAIGHVRKSKPREIPHGSASASQAFIGTRRASFKGLGCVDCANYDRARLGAGTRLMGPAVINSADSTIVLSPRQEGVVDRFGNLLVGAEGAVG